MAPVLDRLHGGIEDETPVDIRKGTGSQLKKAIEAFAGLSKGTEGQTSFEESELARLRDEAPVDDLTPTPEQDVNPFEGYESSQPYTERDPAGDGMQEAYARLREAMNPQTPIWASFSDSGVEGAGYLEDRADVAARDFIKLKQQDRQLDQADSTSSWKAKYDHLIRKGQLKDLISSGAKQQRAAEERLRKQKVAIDKAIVKEERAREEMKWEKRYGDENTKRIAQQEYNKANKERMRLERDQLKYKLENKKDNEGFKLNPPTEKAFRKHTADVSRLLKGREFFANLKRYEERNAPNEAKLKKHWGALRSAIKRVDRFIDNKLKTTSLSKEQIQEQHWEEMNALLKKRSGTAVTESELRRALMEVPDLDSDPYKILTLWEVILRNRERDYQMFMAGIEDETSGKYGSKEKETGYWKNHSKVMGIEGFGKAKSGAYYKKHLEGKAKEKSFKKEKSRLQKKHPQFF